MMVEFDFVFDAKEAYRRTQLQIDHDNESILRNIFADINETITNGRFETYYEFDNIKMDILKTL